MLNSTTSCQFGNAQVDIQGVLEPIASDTSGSPNEKPFAFSQATCTTQFSGFTDGEIVNGIFLLFILCCVISIAYFLHFRRLRIKN